MSVIATMIQSMANQLGGMMGNPLLMALFTLVFFGAWIFMAKIEGEGRILILSGALLLALSMLGSWTIYLFGILIGIFLFLMLYKIVNR